MKIYSDGKMISCGGSAVGSSEEVYSTEETRIGTWIDGKPVYQKTYTFTTGPSIGQHQRFSVADLHIDNLISIDGSVQSTSNNAKYPICMYADELRVSGFISSTYGFYVYTNKEYTCSIPGIVTFKYTKTTDQATNAVAFSENVSDVVSDEITADSETAVEAHADGTESVADESGDSDA